MNANAPVPAPSAAPVSPLPMGSDLADSDETADAEFGYEAALPFLNSQPGDLDLLFSPQHEEPPHA